MISPQDILNGRILIVDDNQLNVDLLEQIVTNEGYNSVLSLTDSRQVNELYLAYRPDLVLLDINMPYLNGFQVMEQIREIEKDSYIPVLIITAQKDRETRLSSLKKGAQDFLTKPFDSLEVVTKIKNLLKIRLLHNQVTSQNIILETKVQERTMELHDTRLEIIRKLGQAAEYRDNETGDHIIRMSQMCATLGKLNGMDKCDIEMLLNTSPMHDVGKIGIPDKIMLKQGKLTADEWKVMKDHTVIGGKLLRNDGAKLMVSARTIALTHHEKWDGSGYPTGLKGEDIPLEGRIAGLVDVFDALTSRRPYKDPYPVNVACKIIKKEQGHHFDPALVDLFLVNIAEFERIKDEFTENADLPTADFKLSERDINL